MDAAHHEVDIAFDEMVGFQQLRLFIDPWEQGFLALLQSERRIFAARLSLGQAMRPEGRAKGLEFLQAVEMIGVIMTDDDVSDRLVGGFPDQADQLLRQRRRSQRIEHHHAVAGDDEAGVGHESLVLARGRARQTLHEITVLAEANRLHRHRHIVIIGMGQRQQENDQQGRQQANHRDISFSCSSQEL